MFVVATGLVSHLVFARYLRSERVHKWAKYGAVLIGGLALIGTISKSNAQLADWRYNLLTDRVAGAQGQVTFAIEAGIELECGTRFVRSEYSPLNFDDIVRQQALACDILRSWRSRLQMTDPDADRPLRLPPSNMGRITDRWARQMLDEVVLRVREHNALIEQRRILRVQRATRPLDVTIAIFGPYLAIFALMIGLATIAFPATPGVGRQSLGGDEDASTGAQRSNVDSR